MTLCNCSVCHCANASSGESRKALPCLFCQLGDEHGSALKEAHRYRRCRSCRGYSRGYREWPEECPACGSSFGPVVFGFDWLSDEEAAAPGWPTYSMVSGRRQAAYTRSIKSARRETRG